MEYIKIGVAYAQGENGEMIVDEESMLADLMEKIDWMKEELEHEAEKELNKPKK